MPTIAEIIATKKAKSSPASPVPAPSAPRESIAETAELQEAINRIDAPGKMKKRLLLKREEEPQSVLPPATPPEPELRALSRTAGEALPLTPTGADAETTAWHQAAVMIESELCLMQDPSCPETAWLALRHPSRSQLPPLLLYRLPWVLWPSPASPSDAY